MEHVQESSDTFEEEQRGRWVGAAPERRGGWRNHGGKPFTGLSNFPDTVGFATPAL